MTRPEFQPRHVDIGVCGLSCRLCPRHHADGASRCGGCKSEVRMAAGCPFLTCGPKRKGIEFCWDCDESASCRKWAAHRESGRKRDSFVSYAALERNIETVRRDGLPAFVGEQEQRERLLREMLDEFNDGRSKSYYCVAATILDAEDLRTAMDAVRGAEHPDARARAKALHAELDRLAASRSRRIALRR